MGRALECFAYLIISSLIKKVDKPSTCQVVNPGSRLSINQIAPGFTPHHPLNLNHGLSFPRPSMPEFDKTQVDKYLSQVLDALVKGDKVALKRFGQRDGFVDNRIRTLVWYLPRRARE